MVVALSLFALISMIVLGGFRIGMRSWSVSDSRIERAEILRSAWQFVGQRVRETQPRSWTDDAGTDRVFQGSEAGFRFVAPLPAHRAGGGLYRIGVERQGQPENLQLIVSHEAYRRAGADRKILPERTLLTDAAEEIKFAYLAPGSEAVWLDSWDSVRDLPRLIRVRLKLRGLDPLELTVAPRATLAVSR